MPIKPFFDPAYFRFAWELMWRILLVGTVLFVVPPTAMPPTTGQQGVALIVLLLWCYYDGLLSRGSWLSAAIEALLWFWLASRWTVILIVPFGPKTQG